MATEIKYKSNTISLEAGQSVSLHTSGKKLTEDVNIAFDTAGSFSYNGNTVEVEKGKTAVLSVAGKKLTEDVVVAVAAINELIGTWVFNDVIDSGYSPFTSHLEFDFVSNGIAYVGMWFEEMLRNSQSIIYSIDDDGYTGDYAWEGQTKTWTNQAYKTITILSIDPEIGIIGLGNFGTWLKANATKKATVSGKWVFNSTLSADVGFDEAVNFKSASGSEYARFDGKVTSSAFVLNGYKTNGAPVTFWHTSTGYQLDPSPIDFGATEQIVSDAFYSWLTANAVKQ